MTLQPTLQEKKPQKFVNYQHWFDLDCFSLSSPFSHPRMFIHASRVNKLSIQRVNGARTLCKKYNPVTSVLIDNAIQNFSTFLQRTVQSVKSGDKQICTVLIGHNSQVFDTPTFFRQGGNQFCQSLSSLNVLFSDSLPLMKKLVKCKHPSLMSTDGSTVKTSQA